MRIGVYILLSFPLSVWSLCSISPFFPYTSFLSLQVFLKFAIRGQKTDLYGLRSIQFNIVSKGLGSERMSFYLNEAAGDLRDLLMPTTEQPKAKL